MRTRLLLALLTPCLLLLPSCSLFVCSMQHVTITATDPDAEIFVDGQLVGTGAASLSLHRNRTHGVVARVGERVGVAHIDTEVSTTGILDLIGGCMFLIPFFGLLGPGFWQLDTDNLTVRVPAAQHLTER